MCALMYLHLTFGTECLIAFITAILTLSCMDILTYLYLTFLNEGFLALITAIWEPSIMHNLMYLHVNLLLNVLLHSSQRYERSPVCIRLCAFILRFILNVYCAHQSNNYARQYVHMNDLSSYDQL